MTTNHPAFLQEATDAPEILRAVVDTLYFFGMGVDASVSLMVTAGVLASLMAVVYPSASLRVVASAGVSVNAAAYS